MAFAELNLAPRIRGRAAKPLELTHVRSLTPADLALLQSETRAVAPSPIAKIRERHHALARCLASGMTVTQAAAATGYDISRVSILQRDPTFQALLQDYRTTGDAVLADFYDRANTLGLTVINNLQEMAEDDEKPLPASMQLEIAKFTSDRTGHAPVVKNMNLNVNVDLGARLAKARQRVLDAQVVEAEASQTESGDSIDASGGS